jgi:hypothetical protein
MMWLGTLMWLIGSALFVASQPRLRVNVVAGGIASSAVISGGLYTGAWVLWIIAACFWIFGALTHLLVTMGQVALVKIAGTTPGIGRWALGAAWLQLLAAVTVLIGSAVFSGGSLSAASAGAILLLIGFTIWGHAILISFGISYIAATVVTLMPDVAHRRYAWSGITATLFLLVEVILLNLASILLVVRDPPGIWLTAGLLYLVAALYGLVGWSVSSRGSYGYFSPILGFTTAAYMTTGALGGTGLLAGAAGGALAAKAVGGGPGVGASSGAAPGMPAAAGAGLGAGLESRPGSGVVPVGGGMAGAPGGAVAPSYAAGEPAVATGVPGAAAATSGGIVGAGGPPVVPQVAV